MGYYVEFNGRIRSTEFDTWAEADRYRLLRFKWNIKSLGLELDELKGSTGTALWYEYRVKYS